MALLEAALSTMPPWFDEIPAMVQNMQLTEAQIQQFDDDGYVLFPQLFDEQETTLLRTEADRVSAIDSDHVFREGKGGLPKAMFALHDADSPTASAPFRAAAHCPRVLNAAKQLLRDDALYLHHLKVNMKASIEGTAWPWHQDFGSWHLDGIARPELMTVMVMLDDATEMNGCLYMLPGSHRDGRTNPYWDDSTAYKLWAVQPEDVRDYMLRCRAPQPITGPAGSVAMFSCNLLHASGHNLSANHRMQAYFCFNRVSNRPADIVNPRASYVRSTDWRPMTTGTDHLQ
ncbi:MAG: phytanoyl-CoA dioxygenase [Chromatiales bacterium]|jgi:ectoine hydroxylase|nr:phytanoyl-CoA dioxygenase [Chromatiales bacterium]